MLLFLLAALPLVVFVTGALSATVYHTAAFTGVVSLCIGAFVGYFFVLLTLLSRAHIETLLQKQRKQIYREKSEKIQKSIDDSGGKLDIITTRSAGTAQNAK